MTALLKPSSTPVAATGEGPVRGAGQPLLSELRALRILVGVGMHYWRSRMAFYMAAFRRKPAADAAGGPRPATPAKQPAGRWLTVLLALSFVWLGFLQGGNYLARMAERLNPLPQPQAGAAAVEQAGGAEAGKQAPKEDVRFDRVFDGELWTGGPGDQPLVSALGLYLLLLSLAQLAFLLGSGQQDLGKVAWDMEWLFTFPVPARTLFLSRLLQNAMVSQLGLWGMMVPCLVLAYGCAGHGWWTLPLALMATGSVALCNASLALLVETWAQKKLAPGRRKNLQAVLAAAASTLSLLTMAIGLSETLDGVIAASARALPPALAVNPFALPAIACRSGWEAPVALTMLGLLGLTLPLGSVQLAQGLVRDGLVASPGAYQGERGPRPTGASSPISWLDGVIGKELRLLTRDRALLVQTLIAPAVILGFVFLLYWHAGTSLLQHSRYAATLAFSVGAYVLVFSTFQGLAAEGNALWLLYTVPKDLGTILMRKTCVGCVFAVGYVVAVLAVAGLAGMPLNGEAALAGGLAIVGVVIYAFIAAALGTLAANPLAADVQRRVRVDVVYAYLVLAGFYAAALQGPSLWALLAQVMLSALVAVALWQKARDRLPYLLEPAASAPPRVSVADGLIAALAYLTVQSFVRGLLAVGTPLSVGPQLLIGTAVAGVVVTLAALILLRRVPGLLVVTGLLPVPGARDRGREGLKPLRTLAPGVVAGLLAGLFGVAYLGLLNRVDALRAWKENWAILAPLDDVSLLAWVVLAAPLFEEFIFRGLLYQGLRRSVSPWVAVVASAAIFAVVHPAISAAPVFILGIATALGLRRSGRLVTPIVTHMTYNAIVVTAEWLMRNGIP